MSYENEYETYNELLKIKIKPIGNNKHKTAQLFNDAHSLMSAVCDNWNMIKREK